MVAQLNLALVVLSLQSWILALSDLPHHANVCVNPGMYAAFHFCGQTGILCPNFLVLFLLYHSNCVSLHYCNILRTDRAVATATTDPRTPVPGGRR